MDRPEFRINGTVFYLPLNPITFVNVDGVEHYLGSSVSSSAIRQTPFFDSRNRTMSWRGLPNNTTNRSIVATLQDAVGISGVEMRYRDLHLAGDQTVWKNIRIQNVRKAFNSGKGPESSDRHLKFDIDVVFDYQADFTI